MVSVCKRYLTISRAQIKIPVVLMKSSDAHVFLSVAHLHTFEEIQKFMTSGQSDHSEL